ncbi:MAG: hypothetical protein Q4D73_07745 [Actinomycetaceae bacterium]|nr:hypothetical protein [Actinomycetaceae bacterium]
MREPTTMHTYGAGYLLRNCHFQFDLEEILPELIPAAYLAKPGDERPWNGGNLSTNYGMGLCRYAAGIRHASLTEKEMQPYSLSEEQRYELSVYSLLTLHEKIVEAGGIQLAPSALGKGIQKVTNLPGNSGACFFDYVAMEELLERLLEETGHIWLVLPWDVDELYLVDVEEVAWEPLIKRLVADFFVEHSAAEIEAAQDPKQAQGNLNYWLLPRYSSLRQFQILLNRRWQEVPPLSSSETAAIDYLNYRAVATLAAYRFGAAGEAEGIRSEVGGGSNEKPETGKETPETGTEIPGAGEENEDAPITSRQKLENLEGVLIVTSQIHPLKTTYLPRCDWIFYGEETKPLCRASTLYHELPEVIDAAEEKLPFYLEISPLTKRQLQKLRRVARAEVADYLAGRAATQATDRWERYPYA